MLQDRALGTDADHWSGVWCGGIAQGSKLRNCQDLWIGVSRDLLFTS